MNFLILISVEIVSKPHPLNQQEDETLVISKECVIPSLDSTLLTQVSTHVVQY